METETKDGNNMSKIEELEQEVIEYTRLIKLNNSAYSFFCQEILEGEDEERYVYLKKLINEDLKLIREWYKDSIIDANLLIFVSYSNSNQEDKVRLDNMCQLIYETHMLIRERY